MWRWKCDRCGSIFDEPELVSYCKEDYNGVSDLFGRRTWGNYPVCPDCGSEDIDTYLDEEEEE